MIHFFDPSDAKMPVKVPGIAKTVDIMLGNLEDAVPIDRKEAAREGLVQIGKSVDFGGTQFWTRVNSLDPRRQGRASLVRQC
jgi:malyl-CoA/(S)-citramalyl-CoA lyase